MQQQPKLTTLFSRITADDAAERCKIAVKWEEEHPPAAAAGAAAALPKRGPGRPPKKREIAAVDDTDAAVQPRAQKPRTGVYTNWFSSPHLLDILQSLRNHSSSAKRTVAALQRSAPDGRHNRLSDSTIRAWFVPGTPQLLPRFQSQLENGAADKRNGGPPSAMTTAMEEEVKSTLLKLRDAGMSVNSHVIRWALQAVFDGVTHHC